MTNIITYGTFDMLHVGHINLLRRAKAYGDTLIVALSTDAFNKKKHKTSYHTFEDRKSLLESIRYVDKVIPENDWNQKKDDIVANNVDAFVMGDDWQGEFDHLKRLCNVIYLPRTEGISTTRIKSDLQKQG